LSIDGAKKKVKRGNLTEHAKKLQYSREKEPAEFGSKGEPATKIKKFLWRGRKRLGRTEDRGGEK